MSSSTFILLSGLLTFGVPAALAVRELLALASPDHRGGPPPRDESAPPRKPLPDCLLPPPVAPVRARAYEDA